MKHLLRYTILLWLYMACSTSWAQDIPLFSQKLTNSFIYNPSLAGHTFGSATYAYRSSFSGVNGNATSNFLSFHVPIKNHRFGVGGNLFIENVNVFRNTFASGAFAYHIPFTRYNILSMGVSAEFNSNQFQQSNLITDAILEDQVLNLPNQFNYDFSFGMNYQSRYFKLGGSINRLATSFELNGDASDVLSEYYSGYFAGMIPVRAGLDLFEPTFTFRKFSDVNDSWEIGAFYTYNNLLIAGASMRKGDVMSFTAGFRPTKTLLIGYSMEMFNNGLGAATGTSSEITLRLDFKERNYQDRFRSDYKNSLAVRRKTLSNRATRGRAGVKNARSLKVRSKRLKQYSPNRRYNNTKKLNTVRKTKSFNSKKRRKSNAKRYKRKRTGFKKRY